MKQIEEKSINAIRILSADAVQKANSGHPGMPLGCASAAYALWANQMNHHPGNPAWENRDRFVLSAGHGSVLLYSLLHLFGYGLTIDDLKSFRQDGSLTPGHPEYGHTVGVEASTGPLGAGLGMAVGLAMAEAHCAAVFNQPEFPIVDHYTYVLGGDGCMMEGISSEAFSLAGTLGLSKLIVLYDSNKITIEGSTDIAFTEDVEKRMEAFGFQTLMVENGNDLAAINKALEAAKAEKSKPSFITIRTEIGYGCAAKQGKSIAHGEPLGEANIKILKQQFDWASDAPFYVPEDVYAHYARLAKEKAKAAEAWEVLFDQYAAQYPKMKTLWDRYHGSADTDTLYDCAQFWAYTEKADATRNLSNVMINRIKDLLPNFIGGSADLASSNKTYMNGESDFSKTDYAGRNLHYGVRELAMAAIANGLALYGLKTYIGTFLVFSDYVKPMARLAALMGLPVTYVLTHDSIGVGEDGPTHEPIEQLAMLRAMPNFTVFRPADATETAAGWFAAITSKHTPTALALTRQNLPQLAGSSKEALKGGYIIAKEEKALPDGILVASGSEVELALHARKELAKENLDIRVVSMPSSDLFEQQTALYRESVLPREVRARVAVEAAADFGWDRYVGLDGKTITMQGFGASAPAQILFEKYGFTVDNVVKTMKAVLQANKK